MTSLEHRYEKISIYRFPPHDIPGFFGVSPAINLVIQNKVTSAVPFKAELAGKKNTYSTFWNAK